MAALLTNINSLRAARFVLVLVLAGYYAYYVSRCWNKYRQMNMGTYITEEAMLSFRFPSVMLCGKIPGGTSNSNSDNRLTSAAQLARRPHILGVRHSLMLNSTEGLPEPVIVEMAFNQTSALLGSILSTDLWETIVFPGSKFSTYHCSMYHPPANTHYGQSHKLDIFTSPGEWALDELLLAVHHPRFVSPYDILESHVTPISTYAFEGRNLGIKRNTLMSIEFVRNEKTDKTKCDDKIDYNDGNSSATVLKCFGRKLSEMFPCYDVNRKDMSGCRPEDVEKMSAYIDSLGKKTQDEILTSLACPIPCLMPLYHVKVESMLVYRDNNNNNNNNDFLSSSVVLLSLYAPLGELITEREYSIYDFEAAAGDVGGMGGILLGASAVALFDDGAVALAAFMAMVRGRRKRTRAFEKDPQTVISTY